ncbi:MAG: DNA polymerase III subunit psi [Vibrio sp.]
MSQLFGSYLHEMGIQSWDLIHPERLQGVQSAKQKVPQQYCLVLVTDRALSREDLPFFERILSTFNVALPDVCRVNPIQFSDIEFSEHLQWVWFAGCHAQEHTVAKQLTSPYIHEIDGNTQHRRALWQQICTQRGE